MCHHTNLIPLKERKNQTKERNNQRNKERKQRKKIGVTRLHFRAGLSSLVLIPKKKLTYIPLRKPALDKSLDEFHEVQSEAQFRRKTKDF